LSRALVFSPRTIGRLEMGLLAGHHLDRFSRFTFDSFDSRLRGYPSASLRFDRGAVARSSLSWAIRPGLRVDAFLDGARVRDPGYGSALRGYVGTGAALEAALPGHALLVADWGYGVQGRDREGQRGTHVIRITAYKVF
jgi:hemolysin activation/secretion protein